MPQPQDVDITAARHFDHRLEMRIVRRNSAERTIPSTSTQRESTLVEAISSNVTRLAGGMVPDRSLPARFADVRSEVHLLAGAPQLEELAGARFACGVQPTQMRRLHLEGTVPDRRGQNK